MLLRKITVLALAGILSTGIGVSVAQDQAALAPEQAQDQREALMKDNGGTLRSAGSLTGAEAVAAAQKLLANYEAIPALFPEGSITEDSKALPTIWENWDGFTAIVEKGKAAAADAVAAAEAGDAAAYGTALKTLGGTCGECHQAFRAADS